MKARLSAFQPDVPFSSTTERRGRPPRLASRPPDGTGRPGCDERIAWLLRTNRLLGADETLVVAARFAAALRDGGDPGPASPAQVSRWETAGARVDHRVIHRYEELLGLAPNSLAAMADIALRRAPLGTGRDMLDRGVDPDDPAVRDDLGQLLDRALSDDPMDAVAWDDLTARLAATPAVYLHPTQAWESLANRLLAEMVVTDGLAWCQRHEALHRLLQHPRGAAPTIATCAGFAADPAHQLFAEPLSSLELAEHPDAFRAVFAQLTAPTSDRALAGALGATIGKVRRRQLRRDELERLVRQVRGLPASGQLPDELRRLVPVLLRHVSAALPGSLDGGWRDGPDPTPGAEPAGGTGGLVQRIAATAQSRLRRDLPVPDLLLPGLVDDMLFHAEPGERLRAGFLIAATPYRDPVAAAVSAELPRSLRGDRAVTVTLLTALAALGSSPDRALIERLVLAAPVGPAVHEAAARALAVVPGRSAPAFWQHALQQHGAAWQRTRSGIAATTLRRLVQGLGVGREDELLTRVSVDPGIPPAIRATARWWLELPPQLRSDRSMPDAERAPHIGPAR